MSLYAVARVMQLSSGMYLAKSQEFPGCEGQSFAQKEAVAHFEEAVTRRITEMFGAGQMPFLYSYDELQRVFPYYCRHDPGEPDRRPGTFDCATIIRLRLPVDAAEMADAEREAKRSGRRTIAAVAERIAARLREAPQGL